MTDTRTYNSAITGEVCVCAIGARTGLGFEAATSAAAVRGGISSVTVHPFMVDRAGKRMLVSRDPGLSADAGIALRFTEMLRSVMGDVTAGLTHLPRGTRIPCWIGMPEPRPGRPADLAQSISDALEADGSLPRLDARFLPYGHAAGLMAMQLAAERIAAGDTSIAIVAAADSYLDPDTLEWLDELGLLMSAINRAGFPPGEAAGACVLAGSSTVQRCGWPVLATLAAASTAREPHPFGSERVCIGEGLSAAIKGVVDALRLPPHAIDALYCDLNGERYRNEEFVYTLLRVQESFVDVHGYLCPADCWGDIGAASGMLFAALAIEANRRGYAKGPRALLWASSPGGYRSALLLHQSGRQVGRTT